MEQIFWFKWYFVQDNSIWLRLCSKKDPQPHENMHPPQRETYESQIGIKIIIIKVRRIFPTFMALEDH